MKFPAVSRLFSKRLVPDQTIVGIFDNDRDLDKAVERLARARFEHTVYNEAIVGEEAINVRCSDGGLGEF
jgi:fructose-1,6-bisphosphatase/inositol monophosphatase family enzyme